MKAPPPLWPQAVAQLFEASIIALVSSGCVTSTTAASMMFILSRFWGWKSDSQAWTGLVSAKASVLNV